MTGLIGPRDTFHPSKEYWSTYIECTELYFTAKNVKDERKVACILSLMGYKTYGFLLHISHPELGFNDIVRILNEHLDPRSTEFASVSDFLSVIIMKARPFHTMLLISENCLCIVDLVVV